MLKFIFLVIIFFLQNAFNTEAFVSNWFKDMKYCSPLFDGEKCEKMDKQYNFYNSIIGGPVILFNTKDFDGFKIGGGTFDFAFGIQTRSGRNTISFEIKQFNQFFMVDSSQIGASGDFNLNANLHGLQFKLIYGRLIGKEQRWKPYAFIAFDLGAGRLSANLDGQNINISAPTVGGAVAIGIDYAVNRFFDIGIELPVGVTVLMRKNGDPIVFPDIYPNFSLKIHY